MATGVARVVAGAHVCENVWVRSSLATHRREATADGTTSGTEGEDDLEAALRRGVGEASRKDEEGIFGGGKTASYAELERWAGSIQWDCFENNAIADG